MEKVIDTNSFDELFIEKLIEISGLMNEFNGQVFSLTAVRKRLVELKKVPAVIISHNIEDTISELPKYSTDYKVYDLIETSDGLVIKVTEEAKRFLIEPDEADVEGFFKFRAIL
jgi:mRNA degradation ribonuclease J1/J2